MSAVDYEPQVEESLEDELLEGQEGSDEPVEATPEPSPKPYRPWLGLVDKYILRTFLGTYFFMILLIISVAIVFDMNEKMDEFVKPEVPLSGIVFDYYLNFIPYYANIFSPLFVFIAVILFTSRFAGNSEIIAMLASGMSFRRLLRPYMLGAALISLLSFVLTNYVIPPGTKDRLDFENAYVRQKRINTASAVQLELEPGKILFIESYTRDTKSGYQLAIDLFEKGDLVRRLTAETATYDTLGRWTLYNYRDRGLGKYREHLVVGAQMDTLLGVDPEDFLISGKDVETLTSPELRTSIRRQAERGVGNVQLFEIELHKRYASVFSAFILTFIGAVLSARKVKNGLGINIAIGLGLSFGYILFMTVTSTFAISGEMEPWLAAWLPNFVFVVIALSLWRKAPQ